ncbi:DUF1684 domain-containing protein [Streptomyces sp. NPDC057456]|uniref:DUF1684 domain-containing protein n=1 Tax=Streptomyces sp. NPDC057456 TaxID=3346139 RepID=UPI0036D1CE75
METVSAPYGPLALTGTFPRCLKRPGGPRLEDFPDGRLPDTPGTWVAEEDAVVLTATGSDGLTVDGKPFSGEARLGADTGPTDASMPGKRCRAAEPGSKSRTSQTPSRTSTTTSSYRFRFPYSGAPDADGRTTVDFNRAVLPPCAFVDAFLCPFPPPGNTYDVAVEAGERNLV